MATDIFNNSSNDYVHPALSPCAGAGDDSYLKFLPNENIGVIQGSTILAAINFSDLKIPVTAYSIQKKTLHEGEVVFISGLTKGLQNRSQGFVIPDISSSNVTLNPYFMMIDLSVNFYKNFKYYDLHINASANYGTSTQVDTALTISLDASLIKINATYDSSLSFSFTGTQEGYDFTVSGVKITLIDSSENVLSPFDPSVDLGTGNRTLQILDLNLISNTLYAKYPNSGMQGIIMKVNFPPIASGRTIYDYWIYINHLTDFVTVYDASGSMYVSSTKTIDIGMNGPSTPTIMSAGDYLGWVSDSSLWRKVGDFYAWTSAPDYTDTINLINGFYLFNPHTWDVQVEYLVFV